MKDPQKKTIQTPGAKILEHGKLPPQALDLEEAIIGACMLEKDAFINIVGILKPESFYKEVHQKLYRAISALFERNEAIDILTVIAELKCAGELEQVGGAYYITQLTSRIASSANIEYYARIVQQKYIAREMIRIGSSLINDAFQESTDVFELLTNTEKQLNEVTDFNSKRGAETVQEASAPVLIKLEQLMTGKIQLTGVPLGLVDLDRVTGGFQPGNLIIIAGRTSMGKSTLALNIAVNCGDYGKRAAYYSLEMSSEELINKIISKKNKIELKRIQRGQIDPDELKRIKKDFEKTEKRLWINDSPTLSTQELRRSCVRLKAKEKIDLVIIDYLQFMHADGIKPGQNREQEISMISRSLKNLAKELDVPVIALSQLSRAVESRGGNMRPRLSDLRESGAIENDADIVIFTFRPEYYKIRRSRSATERPIHHQGLQ